MLGIERTNWSLKNEDTCMFLLSNHWLLCQRDGQWNQLIQSQGVSKSHLRQSVIASPVIQQTDGRATTNCFTLNVAHQCVVLMVDARWPAASISIYPHLYVTFVLLFCSCAAICTSPCQNGGSCSAPDICTCTVGWIGAQCNTGRCKFTHER